MRWGSVLAGAIAALVLLALAGWAYIASGSYNVSAARKDSSMVAGILHGTMEHSVRKHAADIDAPAQFTDEQIAEGAAEYKSMCAGCHGGPGVEARYWVAGMNPNPPSLSAEAGEWDAAEIFWIVKNGVRMTGMPAFGKTHDDATVWNIAAFVEALPTMSPADYAAFEAEDEGEHAHAEADEGGEESGHVDPPGTPPHEH